MLNDLLTFFESMQTSIFEPLLIQFFISQALAHLLNIYFKTLRQNFVMKILVGMALALAQTVIMLLPGNIGTINIDISTIILILAFGFFELIPGIITLIFTLFLYFNDPPHYAIVGLLPILFASISPYFVRRYILSPKRKLHHGVVFLLFAFANSMVLFLTLLHFAEIRTNIWQAVVSSFVILPSIGLLTGLVMFTQREQIMVADELKRSEALQRASINAPKEMEIYVVDHDFNYLSFNEYHAFNLKRCFGEKAKIGQNFLSGIPNPDVRARLEKSISQALNGETFDIEIAVESVPGKYLHDFYGPVYDPKGQIIGATVFSYEITERKKREQNITYISYHDKLTGLQNRRYFDDYVGELSEKNVPVVVIYADVNGLKIMNDMFSHEAGDELLIVTARVLSKTFKNIGVICRTGGDEIITIIEDGDLDLVKEMVNKVRLELKEYKVHDIEVSASFGVAFAEDGSDISEAILLAEDAMYKDKLNDVIHYRSNIVDVLLSKIQIMKLNSVDDKIVFETEIKLGEALEMSNSELSFLKEVVRLRDIGNVILPEIEFLEVCDLETKECNLIRKRLETAYRMLITTEEYNPIANDVISHHENFDGSGVPRGLKGNEIPLKARIIRIAGDFALNLHDNGNNVESALKALKAKSGAYYDPSLVKLLMKMYKD